MPQYPKFSKLNKGYNHTKTKIKLKVIPINAASGRIQTKKLISRLKSKVPNSEPIKYIWTHALINHTVTFKGTVICNLVGNLNI
jgi:hypothetical protein